jgi:hypothetical protein
VTLLLYAVADCDPSDVAGAGLDGARLEAVTDGRLTAVFSEHPQSAHAPTAERLWRYERVIEALMNRHAIVPMRYGSSMADRREVASMLHERHDAFAAAVERVKGKVEVSVHADYRHPPPADPAPSGREYMLGQVERHRRAATLGEHLHGLTTLVQASRMRLLKAPSAGVQAAYLVQAEHVSAFAERVSELSRTLPEVDLVCTGPWPPYTFAEEAGR